MNPRDIYNGSDGQATSKLYETLSDLGDAGRLALNLFRASKCSARAKVYRRRAHKDEAYGRKAWSIENLCKALTECAAALGISWGWRLDPKEEFAPWVLYVDLPTGQASFHSITRGDGPDYAEEWVARQSSEERILLFVEFVFVGKAVKEIEAEYLKQMESALREPEITGQSLEAWKRRHGLRK